MLLNCKEISVQYYGQGVETAIRLNCQRAKELDLHHKQFVRVVVPPNKSIPLQVDTFVARVLFDFKLGSDECVVQAVTCNLIDSIPRNIRNSSIVIEKLTAASIPRIRKIVVSVDSDVNKDRMKTSCIEQFVFDKLRNRYICKNARWKLGNGLNVSCVDIELEEKCHDKSTGGVVLSSATISVIRERKTDENIIDIADRVDRINLNNPGFTRLGYWERTVCAMTVNELEKWFGLAFRSTGEQINGKQPCTSVILVGISGSEFLEQFLTKNNIELYIVNILKIVDEPYMGEISCAIRDTVKKVMENARMHSENSSKKGNLILFEDLELLLPRLNVNGDYAENVANPGARERNSARQELLLLLDFVSKLKCDAGTLPSPIRVACTVSSIASLDPVLRDAFDTIIDDTAPTTFDYSNMIKYNLLDAQNPQLLDSTEALDEDLVFLARECNGLTRSDIQMLAGQMKLMSTYMSLQPNSTLSSIRSQWISALSSDIVSPTLNKKGDGRSEVISEEMIVEKVPSWSSVAGLREVKRVLEENIVWPYLYPEEFDRLGISPAAGLLLYGPPGTGKTLLAKAVADYSGVSFISASITDLMKGDVGGSEAAVANLFAQAREKSPCVIFLDEIQAIFGSRESGSRLGSSMIAQLMLEMDNLEQMNQNNTRSFQGNTVTKAQKNKVVVLAATNRIDLIDASLLRPGRFEIIVHVGLPNVSDREEILYLYISNLNLEPGVSSRRIAQDFAKITNRFTGADLYNFCQCAVVCSMRRYESSGLNLKLSTAGNLNTFGKVSLIDFEDALKSLSAATTVSP